MKVLITGANGILGSAMMRLISGHELFPLLRSECDISRVEQVFKKVKEIEPEVIIHTAAYTDVENCQVDQDKAYLINAIGTENLVNAVIDRGVKFVYISSTGVYGSYKDKPYNEFDEVKPTTIHHKSKIAGEEVVRGGIGKHLVARIGWLFGATKSHQRNFVYNRCIEAKDRGFIYADSFQKGNPTYVENVVRQIIFLIENNYYGTFNCVDNGPVTRHEYVKKIIELAGLRTRVEIAPEGQFKRIAPVSPNEAAVNYKLQLMNIDKMGNWEESLAHYMKFLKICG